MGKLSNYFRLLRKMPGNIQFIKQGLKPVGDNDLKNPKVLLGKMFSEQNNLKSKIKNLSEVEFQVFSQWGDDGIIQYLTNKIDIPNKTFIEFGVENYTESNTRFLLINNNWSGLVIDGSRENIDYIKKDIISWAFDLYCIHSFITKENIKILIGDFIKRGYNKEVGILSIDIDGNDYWIWKEIDTINPIIVIVEYNAVFGNNNAWTIPYQSDFVRLNVHKSYQYWGASLKALTSLADSKGYHFVGCNSNGNNAYFVRKDKIVNLIPKSCEQGFVDSKFREYVDEKGERIGGNKRLELISGMKIFNTETNELETI